MEYRRFENTVIARLNKGEEVLEQIQIIAEKEHIRLAQINALGATDNFTVGVYDVAEKVYHKKEFVGAYEIVSLHGNISTINNEIYLHLHMSCADKDGNVVGGHLNRCIISATCEMFIDIIDGSIDRFKDEETGLNLFKLY